MSVTFNGGFLKPADIRDAKIMGYTGPTVDEVAVYGVEDQGQSSRSQLQPVFLGDDSSSFIRDRMELTLYYDQTTLVFPAKGQFIEGSSNDFHQLQETGYNEGLSGLNFSSRSVKNPHFIVRPDTTSEFLGKDRYDNFVVDPFPTFGQFTYWSSTQNTQTTFNGGDLYSDGRNLHLGFMYLKARDHTQYLADLYYSRYSKYDGTFGRLSLLESDIDVAGTANQLSTLVMNTKVNPRFVDVPGLGLLLASFRKSFSTGRDTSQYFVDFKLSRDDGTSWGDFTKINLSLFTEVRDSLKNNLPMSEVVSPQMNWQFAEGKLVGLINFKTRIDGNSTTSQLTCRGNILVSDDLGKTFRQVGLDLSKVGRPSIFSSSPIITDDICMFYDQKNSKFFVCMMMSQQGSSINAAGNLVVLANRDSRLVNWDVVYTENLTGTGTQSIFSASDPSKRFQLMLRSFRDTTNLLNGHTSGMIPFVNDDKVSYLIMNAGEMFSPSVNVAAPLPYDEYADYTGSSLQQFRTFWIQNPIMVPLELMPSTDSYLGQYKAADSPWRARKLTETGNIGRRNSGASLGVAPNVGSAINMLMDGVAYENAEIDPVNFSFRYPRPRFNVLSCVSFDGDIFMLAADMVMGVMNGVRSIEYQIPAIIHRPKWSNASIKARKTSYLSPVRHYDSTYRGWTRGTAAVGEQILTECPPLTKKNWEIKFARSDQTQFASTNCCLEHLTTSTAFQGRRGAMWDADSTRGAFAHFTCSLDSQFYRDTTNMVHFFSIPSVAGGVASKSTLQTFLGKDHVGFRSSGSAETNFYQTLKMDATRNIEFLVVVNRFRSLDTTHEHRAYMRYEGASDWTFAYFALCAVGNGFSTFAGVRLGNIWRWPSVISASDRTSVVYFKQHSEGWSALEMHRQYPPGVSGVLTPSSDNRNNVGPVHCSPIVNHLPRGFRVGWAGQDSTSGASFFLKKTSSGNSVANVLDPSPQRMFATKRVESNQYVSILVDLGRPVEFDTIALYDYNMGVTVDVYGSLDNTSAMSLLPILSVTSESIAANDINFLTVGEFDTNNDPLFKMRNLDQFVVDPGAPYGGPDVFPDKHTAIIHKRPPVSPYNGSANQKIFEYIERLGGNVVGEPFRFFDDSEGFSFERRCSSCKLRADATSYQLTFDMPEKPWPAGGPSENLLYLNSGGILADQVYQGARRLLVSRASKMVARYLGFSFVTSVRNYNYTPYESRYFLKNLAIGNFEDFEVPIENGMRQTVVSPATLEQKLAGGRVSVLDNINNKRQRFEITLQLNRSGQYEPFGQIESLVKNLGITRDAFYFCPHRFIDSDNPAAIDRLRINRITKFVYLVRLAGAFDKQIDENNATVSFVLEEVI